MRESSIVITEMHPNFHPKINLDKPPLTVPQYPGSDMRSEIEGSIDYSCQFAARFCQSLGVRDESILIFRGTLMELTYSSIIQTLEFREACDFRCNIRLQIMRKMEQMGLQARSYSQISINLSYMLRIQFPRGSVLHV